MAASLLAGAAPSAAQQQDQLDQQLAPQQRAQESEALLVPIRLAARGGDFELAQRRLAELTKPHLVAKGSAALAAEYARIDDLEAAEELYQAAAAILDGTAVRLRERVSALLYIARLQNEDEAGRFVSQSEANYEKAYGLVGQMAGFDLDMSLIELAQTGYAINEDVEQMEAVLGLIRDPALRAKILASYGFGG